MFEPFLVVLAICLYMGLLFGVAIWTERRARAGKDLGNHPLVYSLSLAVYCTAWTYYGSVGKAASSGMLFLGIYLGPTLGILFWWFVLRRLVRIKELHRITSLADLVSLRYGKSQTVAALATLIILVGITPYLALQLKAVVSTFQILTTLPPPANLNAPLGAPSMVEGWVGPLVVGLMIVFTIAFGARRLDPTERHQGIVIAVAVESLVKLAAFLAVGVFVTYFLHNGFTDIFRQAASHPNLRHLMAVSDQGSQSYLTWMSYMMLAMGAIVLLPRQFHVSVVENFDERHIATAMWLFPLYMFLINLFVVPIAMGGLLMGHQVGQADTFVLRLPLDVGHGWLALLVFLGGFSAATAMVMVASMTMATMTTNHLFLPLLERWRPLAFLRRQLLLLRWLAITLILLTAYWFKLKVGDAYLLVDMGIISFAAMAQFAPAVLGGLVWRQGNKAGALMGMSAGFMVWIYTMLLPAFIRSGWLPEALLQVGPWGLAFLAPEHLFGTTIFDPLTNTVFWSLLFNGGLYILGSLWHVPIPQEQRLAEELATVMWSVSLRTHPEGGEAVIRLDEKVQAFYYILAQYLPLGEALEMISQALRSLGVERQTLISLAQFADLYAHLESALAGSIGAADAHLTMTRANIFTPEEAKALVVDAK